MLLRKLILWSYRTEEDSKDIVEFFIYYCYVTTYLFTLCSSMAVWYQNLYSALFSCQHTCRLFDFLVIDKALVDLLRVIFSAYVQAVL